MDNRTVRPLDSFTAVYKILQWTGYYKLSKKPKSKLTRICFILYRMYAFSVTLLYIVEHLLFSIQSRDNMDVLFDCLIIGIPQTCLLVKYFTMNLKSVKINEIHEILNNPFFSANNEKDVELLSQNTEAMHRLCKIIQTGVTVSSCIWPVYHFSKRYRDETAVVPIYVPFETNTWTRFTYSVLLDVVPVLWIGYGHIAFDIVIATYYAQAEVQLKIIKYNLNHLFDVTNNRHRIASCYGFRYIDEFDVELKTRFVKCLKRYEMLTWYTEKVAELFNHAIMFQFICSNFSICLVLYKMSVIQLFSVSILFLITLLMLMLCQIFLYCYYGNRVQYESQFINTSVYTSDWLSTSPRFRRLLVIAMTRWTRTLTPTVSKIVPLTLNTFVSIMKSVYSIYAVLKTT